MISYEIMKIWLVDVIIIPTSISKKYTFYNDFFIYVEIHHYKKCCGDNFVNVRKFSIPVILRKWRGGSFANKILFYTNHNQNRYRLSFFIPVKPRTDIDYFSISVRYLQYSLFCDFFLVVFVLLFSFFFSWFTCSPSPSLSKLSLVRKGL